MFSAWNLSLWFATFQINLFNWCAFGNVVSALSTKMYNHRASNKHQRIKQKVDKNEGNGKTKKSLGSCRSTTAFGFTEPMKLVVQVRTVE